MNHLPRLLTFIFLVFPLNVQAFNLYLSSSHEFSGFVRLGDICRIENARDQKSISEKLVVKNLERPLYISADELKKNLDGHVPESVEKIFGVGIWLIPLSKNWNADELQALLETQISALEGSATILSDYQITLPKATNLNLPASGVELRFRLPAHARSLKPGRRILALDILYQDTKKTFLLRKQIMVDIKKWIDVAVAIRDMPAGHKLTKNDYRIEKRAIYSGEKDFVNKNIVGMKALASVVANSDLTVRNVQNRPVIQKGQKVGLVIQSPGLVLKIKSIAQQSGEIGEMIPVKVLLPGGRFGKQIKARIMDENKVVIEAAQI